MEVAVFDTYVKKRDGGYLHFDIIVTKETPFEEVLVYGNTWLQTKKGEGLIVSQKDCRFCHLTEIIPRWEAQIRQKGIIYTSWKVVTRNIRIYQGMSLICYFTPYINIVPCLTN